MCEITHVEINVKFRLRAFRPHLLSFQTKSGHFICFLTSISFLPFPFGGHNCLFYFPPGALFFFPCDLFYFVKDWYCLHFFFFKNRFLNLFRRSCFSILYTAIQYTVWFVKHCSIKLLDTK